MQNYQGILSGSSIYRAGTLTINGQKFYIIYYRTVDGLLYQALYSFDNFDQVLSPQLAPFYGSLEIKGQGGQIPAQTQS